MEEQPRDRIGRWTSGSAVGRWTSGGSADVVRAADALRGREAAEFLRREITGDRVKSAIAYALQNALFHATHVEDPVSDAYVESQVQMLGTHLKVTRGHARNLMIAAVRRARELRKK